MFLDPVPALLAGAIAVPALIALYLLKLRRKPLKVSSTLLWEQVFSDLQANVPLRWLRVSWPLVIQLAALLCLLLAFARPTIPGDSTIARRVVIVVDRSASMSASDGQPPADAGRPPRTRLDEAKDKALAIIDDLARAGGRRPAAMVVELAAAPRVLAGFTDDPRTLRDALRSIEPSDQPADIAALLPLLRGVVVQDAEREALATTIVLFTDGGLEPVVAAGARAGLPRSVRVQIVRAGPAPDGRPDNLAIVAASARRDAATPSLVRVFVRVQNSGGSPREVALLASVDGVSVGTIPLAVPAAPPTIEQTAATPGQAAGTLEFSLPAEGLLTLTIPRPDLLVADNTVGLMVPSLEKPRVLVVGPGVDPGAGGVVARRVRGEQGVDRFLLGVLAELELGQLRVVSIADYEAAGVEAERTTAYDLIIFDRASPRSLPSVATLSIGAGLPVPGLTVEPLVEADARAGDGGGAGGGRSATRFISWRRTHPALRYAPLDAVLIAPPMRMTIDEPPAPAPPTPTTTTTANTPAAPTTIARPTITPLAFGAGGPLIAEVFEPGIGTPRRLVLAMDLLQTNWGPDVSFPVFIASAVEYLSGRSAGAGGDSAAARSGRTHEPVTVRAAPGIATITVLHPVPAAPPFPPAPPAPPAPTTPLKILEPSRTASLGVPERVGVYTFQGAVAADRTLPVNLLSPIESALGTSDDAAAILGASGAAAAANPAASEPGRREVWHWFVFAAIALLTLEWFVYAWKMRL